MTQSRADRDAELWAFDQMSRAAHQNGTLTASEPVRALPDADVSGEALVQQIAEVLRSSPNGPHLWLPGPTDLAPSFARAVVPLVEAQVAPLRDEVERLKRGGKELGRILDRTLRDALDASGRHDAIDVDGDGDWAVVWETLAELRPRAEAAEARLDALVADLRELHLTWGFLGAVLDKHAGEVRS